MNAPLMTSPNSGTPVRMLKSKKYRILHSRMGFHKLGKDATIQAAGVMFLTPDGQLLLVKRSAKGDHAGEWGIPGGKVEPEDTDLWTTAYREVNEELGEVPPGQGGMKAANTVMNGVDFTTFFNLVDKPFIPSLDQEHTAFMWGNINSLPENTHPGVVATVDGLMEHGGFTEATSAKDMDPEDWSGLVGGLLKFIAEEAEEPEHAADAIALDEGSVRNYDADGRMHVEITHISKANVCPYYGREIPYAESLGLDPDRVYNLYRHPDELAKAAGTFNNLPLLSKHVPVSADDHPNDLVLGSTGTDATFNDPYLDNSLVIWTRGGISAIEEEVQKELSCAYRYEPEMICGVTPDGQHYDGVMRNIIGNHVALVRNGRAGSDVVVGDSALPKLKEIMSMPKSAAVLSRKASVAKGALIVHLRPKLAADAQIDLTPILQDVTQENFGEKKAGILSGLKTALKGKLAKDADIADVTELLDALEECEELDGEVDGMDEGTPDNFLKKKMSAEDKATYDSMCAKDKAAKDAAMKAKDEDKDEDEEEKKKKKAEDADKDDDDDKKDEKKKAEDKKAMDSAINAAVEKVKADAKATRQAEQACRPYVGELAIACDSADEVYAHTLKALGVDIKGVPPVAFPAILKAQPLPGSRKNNVPAMDSAAVASFSERFPGADRIKSV